MLVAACNTAGGRRARHARRALLAPLVLVVLLLTGCQVRVATDIVVQVDGSGSAALRIVVDEELAATLEEADVDLQQGLEEAAAGADWSARVLDGEDGTGVELTTSFDRPEQLGLRVDALFAGLDTDDGALLRDVELSLTEDGGYEFSARAGLLPPRVVGSLPLAQDGATSGDDEGTAPPRFDGDDLAAALEEGGDEVARADLRVTFPTQPTSPEGEVVSTSTTWALPNHELASVSASAPPLPLERRVVLYVAIGLGAALLAAFLVRMTRRR